MSTAARFAIGMVLGCALCATPALAADDHELKLPAEHHARPGDRGAVSLLVSPKAGYTISRDAEVAVDLTVRPAEGLELPRRRYRRKDAADARADAPRFDLAFTATRAGVYTLTVDARFWVCAKHTCRPVSERRTVTIHVEAPPPPPPDAGAGPATATW